jgi:threonine aldolase
MILGDQAHIFFYEQGGSSALGGIHPRTIPNLPDGKLDLEQMEAAIRPDDVHFPRTRLIVLENTHNRCYGSPIEAEYMQTVGTLAAEYGLKIHVDGARIFNAATALETTTASLVKDADSVSFCLSKGLAAPVGSLVCGTRDFILAARRNRKILGGGMRQAGILAAAGIVAITEMTDRLSEDHANAKALAKGLSEIGCLSLDIERVKTNIVFVDVNENYGTAADVTEKLKSHGVLCLPLGPQRFRAVTHHPITADDIDHALASAKKALG